MEAKRDVLSPLVTRITLSERIRKRKAAKIGQEIDGLPIVGICLDLNDNSFVVGYLVATGSSGTLSPLGSSKKF